MSKWVMEGNEIILKPWWFREAINDNLLKVVVFLIWLYSVWAKTFDYVFKIKEEDYPEIIARVRRKRSG